MSATTTYRTDEQRHLGHASSTHGCSLSEQPVQRECWHEPASDRNVPNGVAAISLISRRRPHHAVGNTFADYQQTAPP